MNAQRLSAAALAGFLLSLVLVWSNPGDFTRGPFIGEFTEPAMLIFIALGTIAALLGTLFGRKGMGRGLGIAVFILGLLNTLLVTWLITQAGFGALREGLVVIELASFATVGSGLWAIVKPAAKK